jgi:ketosteroid isomerase-like protein
MKESPPAADESQIRNLLEQWALATRQGRTPDVLKRHAPDLLVYDVLPPMKYEGAETYRRSWDDWQPATRGQARFDLEDLSVTAGAEVAYATCFIRCGGTLTSGRTFEDVVRATFCLRKARDGWLVAHQHVSKPLHS